MSSSPLLSSAVGVATVLAAYAQAHARLSGVARRRALAATVRTVGALAFPAVLHSLVPREDRRSTLLAIPLAWNAVVWAIDAHLLHHGKASEERGGVASLRIDPSSVTPLAFGLCSLVGARPDSAYTHLFLYAVVGCIVLVLPTHNLAPDTVEAQLFENVQKAVLMWCIGLVVTGVVLTRSHATATVACVA